jgi:hypothetical protein
MAENQNFLRRNFKSIVFKALKATVKGIIFYMAYFFLWSLVLAPYAEFFPWLELSVETFITIYIVLMIIGELTAGTIYQHFFGVARALFVVGYLVLTLQGGLMSLTFENVNLLVDLRMFLMMAMLFSLLGLAKSVLHAINYMSEKAETAHMGSFNVKS